MKNDWKEEHNEAMESIPEAQNADVEVEGYGYCATDKQRCMQDCNGSAFLSTLN